MIAQYDPRDLTERAKMGFNDPADVSRGGPRHSGLARGCRRPEDSGRFAAGVRHDGVQSQSGFGVGQEG